MYKNRLLYWISKIYNYFIFIGNNLQALFLLYMRITWGYLFFHAGLGKLQSIQGVIDFFTSLNIPQAGAQAYMVAYIELICGFLLFIGLAARMAAIPLIIVMLVALSTAHAANISEFRFLLEPMSLVKETPYPFLITSVMVFVFGPGRISIDAWLKRWAENQPKY